MLYKACDYSKIYIGILMFEISFLDKLLCFAIWRGVCE